MSKFNAYTVGWICAVGKELVAAKSFLDEEHDPPDHVPNNDNNTYILGRIGKHSIVIAAMPVDQYGLVSAATVARDMMRSFPGVRIGLMVGIGGGAPSLKHDIRLGDIVVSCPSAGIGGVLQYDHGKTIQGKKFSEKGHLNQPPQFVLTALAVLEAEYESEGHRIEEAVDEILEKKPRLRQKYRRPDASTDRLYVSSFTHKGGDEARCTETCGDDKSNLVSREDTSEVRDNPTIHRGLIASANQLMKNALVRDTLSKEKDVLCFEMEAAGLMNHFPCIVIRGICDYSDTHKNDQWQGYAAMVAAAYAKDLLCKIAPNKIEAEKTLSEALSNIDCKLSDVQSRIANLEDDECTQRLVTWLSAPDPSTNLNRALDHHHPGTGSWLLDSAEYLSWITRENSILWLNGIPGCGKTVLSSTIIEDLENAKGYASKLLYFYFDFNDSAKQTFQHMLCSLIIQLYRKENSVRHHLDSLYNRQNKHDRRLSIESLRTTFKKMVCESGELFIVLDALDECGTPDYPKGGLLGWSSSIGALEKNIHLLVTSRIEHGIKSVIKKWPFPKDTVTLRCSFIHDDISRYIEARLQGPEFWDWPRGVQESTKIILVNKADGMFRWVVCQLDTLKHCHHQKAVQETLNSLPKTLDETYARILENVPEQQRPYTTRILQFLAYSDRPLTIRELAEAAVVEMERRDPFDPACRLWNAQEIIKYCSNLVVIAAWTGTEIQLHLRLAHSSVKEYLTSTNLAGNLGNDCLIELSARASIAKVCIAYLLQICKRGKVPSGFIGFDQDYPLACYAASYWISHAVVVESSSAAITNFILEFLSCPEAWKLFNYIRRKDHQLYNLKLNFAAVHGLFHTAQYLIKDGEDINVVVTRDFTSRSENCALWNAARGEHHQIIELLMNNGAVLVDKNASFLAAAASRGLNDMIKNMISKGVDINSHDTNHCVGLLAAVKFNHEDTVRMLLDNHADVKFECGKHGTILDAAVETGRSNMIKLLLDHGAVFETRDNRGRTPLHNSAWYYSPEKVKLLVHLGADINAEDWQGQTPLHLVASRVASGEALNRKYDEVAKILIDNDANVNAEDDAGRTVIHMAAIHSHRNLIKLLEDRGVNIDTENFQGKTPLQVAIERDHEFGVRKLLEFGADINRVDKCGRTPLQLAVEKRYKGVAMILRESGAKDKDR
ncbi:uncharacterized protein GGS22DRAFT_194104 [Annulohypoxylon maeteangense]|uniref:uncharacterized protein n=1 Tax=Annulohypoxylon maeteangense TaxID=1927788 RepID=UPI0020073AE6|nr:uncharacterized protein GGS22DRAFT_194104 [Annulohypoxylon maeteangense]KAI0889747.1 hypothetical protein GGS22DRAFT_194104 [Annulohypoxylon maeteangense]